MQNKAEMNEIIEAKTADCIAWGEFRADIVLLKSDLYLVTREGKL